jgi:integrase
MAGKRQFGSIRKLRSGRWQARYQGPDGIVRPAPETFERKRDAAEWLAEMETEIAKGEWRDPEAAQQLVNEYAATWIRERPGLRPRTVELYEGLLRRHIEPYFSGVTLAMIDNKPARIRAWRADLLAAGVSVTVSAKAYRLLRAVLHTAVDDDVIRRNPCRIKGADQEHAAERPTLTPAQVAALAERMPPRLVALVMLATYASLRWGELAALRRGDLDLAAATVRVERTQVEVAGRVTEGPTKSRAGRRVVAFPPALVPLLRRHLAEYVGEESDALIFTGPKSARLRRNNFGKLVGWREAVTEIGAPDLHFHDLRHTGNAFAAKVPGTTIRDLMSRMGHDSTRAAMIYLHGSPGADRTIADALPVEAIWHGSGTRTTEGGDKDRAKRSDTPVDLGRSKRAGDGNRTRMASLEGWGSAIELHPRVRRLA